MGVDDYLLVFCRNHWSFLKTSHWKYPRKLQHTPGAHPRQSPYPTMKGFPLQPIGKGCSGCVPKVCWNNLRKYGSSETLPGHKGKNYIDSLKWSSFEHGDARNFMKITGCWLNQPLWKIWTSKWVHPPPRFGVKIPKIFELPPPRLLMSHSTSELLVESKVLQENSSLNIGNILNSSSQTPFSSLSFEAHHVFRMSNSRRCKKLLEVQPAGLPPHKKNCVAGFWSTSWTYGNCPLKLYRKNKMRTMGIGICFPQIYQKLMDKLMVNL